MTVELVNMSDPNIALALTLVFCIIFLALGFKRAEFMVMGGIVWIGAAIAVFINYGNLFVVIGLGMGLIMMLEGGQRL